MTVDDRDGRLFVAHHHPGRLRVRAPEFERDEALRESVCRSIADHSAVASVKSDARTGSVLVLYDPIALDAGTLLERIAERARLTISEPVPRVMRASAIFDAASDLDARVLELSGGRFGLRMAVPAALFAGSIASFAWSDHTRTPRWDNLLYWSVHFFRTLNHARATRPAHASER